MARDIDPISGTVETSSSGQPDAVVRESRIGPRLIFIVGVVIIFGFAAALLVISLDRDSHDNSEFHGTVLQTSRTPPQFSLEDQHGEFFDLSDARGKTVALTFLYTSCTDVCPFVGIKLRSTMEIMNEEAADVVLVAISTDPVRDTFERISDYTSELGIFDELHYVTGEESELAPLWDGYLIGDPIVGSESSFASREDLDFYGLTAGLDDAEIAEADRARGKFGGGYDVSHGTPVWLINADGDMVAKLDQAGTPQEWADDIAAVVNGL